MSHARARISRHITDHQVGAYLKNQGCDNENRVMRHRGWTFPPLKELRAAWEKRFPRWKWRIPGLAEWQNESDED